MPSTHNLHLAPHAIDVLFHPTSRTRAASCPLHPPAEADMDAAGISRALVSQCKKWSCERQWMCVDTRLEDVLRYTDYSSRYAALAGYNPFDIADSLREIEFAVTTHAFHGVYLHAASFNLPLADARMYPLFAKAAELAIPVLIQLPTGLDLRPELKRLAADFPGLAVVLALPSPNCDQIAALADECEDVYFALDPGAIAYLQQSWGVPNPGREEAKSDVFSEVFQERCIWGSNGMDWPDALRAADSFLLAPPFSLPGLERQGGDSSEVKANFLANFLRRNAERVFAFDQPPACRMPRSALTEILVAER